MGELTYKLPINVLFWPDFNFAFMLGDSNIFEPDGDLLGLSKDSGDIYIYYLFV